MSVIWQNNLKTIIWQNNVIKIVKKNQIESDIAYLYIYHKTVNMNSRDIMIMTFIKLQIAKGEIKTLMHMKTQ